MDAAIVSQELSGEDGDAALREYFLRPLAQNCRSYLASMKEATAEEVRAVECILHAPCLYHLAVIVSRAALHPANRTVTKQSEVETHQVQSACATLYILRDGRKARPPVFRPAAALYVPGFQPLA